MAKLKNLYICQQCGYESSKWLGKCPSCNEWNCFVEEVSETKKSPQPTKSAKPVTLNNIQTISEGRTKTQIKELDRVLGGGIVQGSMILVGGDPGIGKSTLLLQISQQIGNQNIKILYVSGEESVQQIKMRADRLKINTNNLLLISETNLGTIEATIANEKPTIVIIDSIQTIYKDEVSSAPGSVSQVRECTGVLMKIAKGENISIIIVGHVTKEGAIAGPRVLEHMVDTVLYFEGERHASYRILRCVKNRFGSTNEIGMFEMQDIGLVEVTNPSEYMLSGRAIDAAGSVVTCSIEGSRPLLTEVQSLISYTNFGVPRRTATGIDYNRVAMLMAVMEKKLGMKLSSYDSYVNLAGGIKAVEPALDLAIVASIASSFKNIPIDPYTVVFGEVGLAGEVRAVSMAEKRVNECVKLGFKVCMLPETNFKSIKNSAKVKLHGIKNVTELYKTIL